MGTPIHAIRPVVMGRKGWLFSDTTDGAEATAIVYSLMEKAKANNLRLEDYVQYLLTVFCRIASLSIQIWILMNYYPVPMPCEDYLVRGLISAYGGSKTIQLSAAKPIPAALSWNSKT